MTTSSPKPARARRLVEFAETLKEHAATGAIIGALAVVLLPGRRYIMEVIGEPERDPVFARGALQSLDDLLAELAKQRLDATDTTL